MSWHFSQALVGAYLEGISSAGEQFVQSKETPMPQAFLSPDRMTAFSRLSLYGMTFAPLTADHGEAVLTWFLAASPAKTSVPPAAAPAWKEPVADCGRTWLGSFARWDHVSCSWRTPQCSLLADLDVFSATWPRWGMMRIGVCWALPTPELPTKENEFGFWPTPQASDSMRARMSVSSFKKVHADSRGGRSYLARILAHEEDLSQSAAFTEWLMSWPNGWTAYAALGTDRFRQWQLSHGRLSADLSTRKHEPDPYA